MLGVALGLAASLSWGIADFLGGQESRRMPALSVLLVTQPLGLALAVCFALAVDGAAPDREALQLGLLAGGLVVLSLAAFYRAMALGAVSVAATIASMGVLVPFVGGLVQGEKPAPIALLGAVTAIAGVILVSRQPGGSSDPVRAKALGLAALAALGIGTGFLLIDAAADGTPEWTIVAVRVGGVATLLLAALVVRPSLRVQRSSVPALVAIGVLEITANLLFAAATNHGLLSLVSVSATLYSAVTVVLAWLILGERLAKVQRLGVALALGGVAMIGAAV